MPGMETYEGTIFDAAVAGGGLAGLAYAILMADAGFRVVVCEKEGYPLHRVCGEYISMESWDFLCSLGLPLSDLGLPRINKLIVSDTHGKTLKTSLSLGGFGISRYTLDAQLCSIARSKGVTVLEHTKVNDISFSANSFTIHTSKGEIQAIHCLGSFGKRSSLDLKWKRPFTQKKPGKLNNHIGIKYHIEIDFPKDMIALHNFENGYCGLSAVEDGKYCLCYMASAADLSRCGNSIESLEKEWLSRNPYLKDIFKNSTSLYSEPVTISQIGFHSKSLIENHVLMAGDSAGLIPPLCGNGMSMALRAAQLVAHCTILHLRGSISRDAMEMSYRDSWSNTFSKRLRSGRVIQTLFGRPAITSLFLNIIRPFPAAVKGLITLTHGKPF